MTITDAEQIQDDLDPFTRDQYGRPLIADPRTGEIRSYMRISTFAGVLTDKFLATYHQWWAMRAYKMFPDEAEVIASAHDQKGQQKAINDLLHRAGMNLKRDRGIARHTRVRQALTNVPMPELDDTQRAQLEAVADMVRSLGTVTGVEVPLVNDEWQLAGSADYVGMGDDGRPFVADLKTGGKYGNDIEWALQLVAYARSQRWDRATSTRGDYICDQMPRLFVVHAPQDSPTKLRVYEYDPAVCKTLAGIAVNCVAARSMKPLLEVAA